MQNDIQVRKIERKRGTRVCVKEWKEITCEFTVSYARDSTSCDNLCLISSIKAPQITIR
jgi:hypothetical protein